MSTSAICRRTVCAARLAGCLLVSAVVASWGAGCERKSGAGGAGPAERNTAKPQGAAESPSRTVTGGSASAGDDAAVPVTASGSQADSSSTPAATSQPPNPGTHTIAYYFHRTVRCATCLAIESQAKEAIEVAFREELEDGRIEWHAVNIEEPGSEHFEHDFNLDRQALVLVEVEGEKVVRFKKLERVWELVEDPPAFQEYVWAEASAFLDGP